MSTPYFDLLIIGAGAAGLGAVLHATHQGFRTVVLEAKGRVGGRAYTDTRSLGYPFDLGCHWLHSADQNPLTSLALEGGFSVEATPKPSKLSVDGAATVSIDPESAWRRDAEAQLERISRFGDEGLTLAAEAFSRPETASKTAFEGWFSMLNGTGTGNICARDHSRYMDTGENWVTPVGYGAVIAAQFKPFNVRLNHEVRRITLHRRHVQVDGNGFQFVAGAVILTVSTGVLANGGLVVEPGFEARKMRALAALPLGYAERVGFLLPEGFSYPPVDEPDDQNLLTTLGDTAVSFQIRPGGYPIVSAYFGGWHAASLARSGPPALVSEAIRHFKTGTGRSLAGLRAIASSWTTDPHVRGAYSTARPLTANSGFNPREVLAEPVAGKLFFAGEATSERAYSTAHGAFQSGIRAAEEVRKALG